MDTATTLAFSAASSAAARPAWKAATRLLVPTIGRWPHFGGFAACLGLVTAGFDWLSGTGQRGCAIERFHPDGTSAGVLFNAPCPGAPSR